MLSPILFPCRVFFARHGTVLYEPNHETVVLRSKRGHGEGQHTTNNQPK